MIIRRVDFIKPGLRDKDGYHVLGLSTEEGDLGGVMENLDFSMLSEGYIEFDFDGESYLVPMSSVLAIRSYDKE